MKEYRKILAVYGDDPGIDAWLFAFRNYCPGMALVIIPAKKATYSPIDRESTPLIHGIPRPVEFSEVLS